MDLPLQRAKKKPPQNTADACWVFDLDNTLYPEECNLFGHIDAKMGDYIAALLGVGRVEAKKVQKDYFVRFGTTLRGLIDVHGVDPEEFLNFVHDIDLSALAEDKELGRALKKLKGRKIVFTNGDIPYAERVLKKIGIRDQFEGIFDIARARYLPKPHAETYRVFVDHFEVDPGAAVMVEDMARNLVPAARMGMTTVWVKTRDAWGSVGHDAAHIDFETDNLVHWLNARADESP